MLRARSLLGRGGVGTGDKANLNIVCSLCTACKRGARTDNNLYAEYITRNARLDESQAGIKIAGRNINKLTYTDDTTLMAERKELKSLLMKVKEVSEKVGLKFNIKKRKIIASGPFTSWQTMEKQWKLTDFIFLGSKITADGDCSHEIKRCLLLGEKKSYDHLVEFSHSVVSNSLWPHGLQHARLPSITYYWSLLKPMSIVSVMPYNHLILCCPLLLLPSVFPSIRDFFKWVSSLHQVAKILEFQYQSFQWLFMTDFL